MKKWKVSILVSLLVLLLAACEPPTIEDVEKFTQQPTSTYIDYGDGVYYIGETGANFIGALKLFKSEVNEPIISIIANGTGDRGKDVGYYIITEKVNDQK